MFEIETSVPVPEKGSRKKYPFSEMAVGDSFLVPCDGDTRVRTQATTCSAVKDFRNSQENGWAGRTSMVDGGVRVWRTA